MSLKKLVYLDGQKAVLYRSKMNPRLERNFEPMDPPEWLARMADHIPDAGKHRTHFYGFYASRVRAPRRDKEGSELPEEPVPANRRCSPSWARLISKVYQADPLVCRQCGGKLKVIAYVSDEISVKRILAELGLSPEEEKHRSRGELRHPHSRMVGGRVVRVGAPLSPLTAPPVAIPANEDTYRSVASADEDRPSSRTRSTAI